jgi:uncharacterized protein (TIGR02466 family)
MLIINECFQSFIATDMLYLDNKSIESFCYFKIKNDPSRPSSPNQANVTDLEKSNVLQPLMNAIQERVQILLKKYNFKESVEYRIRDVWINLNHPNATSMPHKHPNHLFSGVYYVKCDNPSTIDFFNPISEHQWVVNNPIIGARNEFNSQYISVEPVVGKVVLFPSWLMHSVRPSLNDKDRISIAFNVDAVV